MSQKSSDVGGERSIAGSETVRPAQDVVAQRLGDSAVIVRLTTNRIYELNATGRRIWELMRDGATRDGMLARLVEEFDVQPDAVGCELDELLDALRAEGLITDDRIN
jgi:hypothetical protein